jgi:hypothetical protein
VISVLAHEQPPGTILCLVVRDQHNFSAHNSILAAYGPFSNSLFAFPQQFTKKSNGDNPCLPVIELIETADILDGVYPDPGPPVTSIDTLVRLLVSAYYEMTCFMYRLHTLLASPEYLNSMPLYVYVIAARFELEEEVQNTRLRHSSRMMMYSQTA